MTIGLEEIEQATTRLNAIAGEHTGPGQYPAEKICELLGIDYDQLRQYCVLHAQVMRTTRPGHIEEHIFKTFMIGFVTAKEGE